MTHKLFYLGEVDTNKGKKPLYSDANSTKFYLEINGMKIDTDKFEKKEGINYFILGQKY